MYQVQSGGDSGSGWTGICDINSMSLHLVSPSGFIYDAVNCHLLFFLVLLSRTCVFVPNNSCSPVVKIVSFLARGFSSTVFVLMRDHTRRSSHKTPQESNPPSEKHAQNKLMRMRVKIYKYSWYATIFIHTYASLVPGTLVLRVLALLLLLTNAPYM